MKRWLFWKILVGFWLTLILIALGISLAFTLVRPDPEVNYMRAYARLYVEAASSTLMQGGPQAFETERQGWPRDWRDRVRVTPAAAPQSGHPPIFSQQVSGPDGTAYRVSYRPNFSRHEGFFGIPPQILFSVVIGGLGFSAILAWYLTQPIRRMQGGFERLARGDFTTRLGPSMGRRRDEIASLAHDFDTMAMRLAELVGARDRLLADVSHELRTPLARLNLAIGLARQDPAKLSTSLDRISDEAGKLDEMVGELLTLAKLESNQNQGEDYFNFAEIVKRVVEDARYEASAKNIEVKLAIEQADENFEWIALGSGKLVSRALENILRNALRYSPENGQVVVRLGRNNGRFHLSVSDDGPGIPKDSLASLFKPFGISADGFGFGLGLAIAQRAIAVHGGTISAANRVPHGLEMTVMIPAAIEQSV
ncbi:MAG TPA: HAMP domain-containing sensor histidine kinase [Rhizomicrobium sp.]|nr:HAMP domain-containing sensor histidine kinase [Rhizomicrobium sp.]